MPNWCSNDVVFQGTENDLDRLEALLQDAYALKGDSMLISALRGFDAGLWLGSIALVLGYDIGGMHYDRSSKSVVPSESGEDSLSVRGQLYDYHTRDAVGIRLACDSAWGPALDLWDAIASYFEYDVSYDLLAEEPGCGVYINTDTSYTVFCERYILDPFDYEIGSQRFSRWDDLQAFIKETYGIDAGDFSEAQRIGREKELFVLDEYSQI